MNGVWFKFLNYCQTKFKTDIEIPVSNDKITLVDAAHVCMCEIVSDGDNIKIDGITGGFVSFMKERVKSMKYDKKTEFTFKKDESGTLYVSSNTGIYNYAVGNYRTEREFNAPKLPPLDYDLGQFRVKFDEIDKAVDDIGKLSDHVQLIYSTSGILTINAREECGSHTVKDKDGREHQVPDFKIVFHKEIKVSCSSDGMVSREYISMFPIDYIRDILGSNLTKSDIHIRMTDNYPITMEWAMMDNSGIDHHVKWLLAPRIESDY